MNEDAKARMENMLREAGPILKKMDQVVVPPHVLAKLREAKERNFPVWQELTAKEMEPLLLSVLAKRQMDGFEIISSLEKAHIRIKGAGEAVNYGVLATLVAAGYVRVDLEDRSGQIKKLYRLTEDGHAFLKKYEAPELQTLTAAVLSAG